MVKRCSTCQCVLRFRPAPRAESLCPHELKRDFLREARERGDWSYYQHRMNGYGTQMVWGIAFNCPGCEMCGTQYSPNYSESEAEAIVAAQNAAADEAERQGEPLRWQEVVWERMTQAARNFADLFISRFPQWSSCIRLFPANRAEADAEGDGSGYVLALQIPSEHPRLSASLEVSIRASETLVVWGDWHTHVNARDNDPTDREHLQLALDIIEEIVEEQVIIGSLLRENDVVAGGSVSICEELPRQYTHPESLGSTRVDRVIVRSWRGTYDRQVYPRSRG